MRILNSKYRVQRIVLNISIDFFDRREYSMELRQLKSFKTVANLLSFNKAAGQLHYAQSSISVQIHGLEEELGVQLFDRLGKRVQLTETGTLLLQYANKILDLVEETNSAVTGDKEPVGSLTVRIPETFGVHRLPAVLKEFNSKFPRVQLNFITCALEGLAKDLRKGVTDLAFLLAESISAPDLDVETLGFESVVLVASPDHPLSSKRSVHTRDLAGATILLSRADCSYRRIFEQILKQEEVASVNKFEFNSVEVIKQSVAAGLGVSVLPEIAVAEEVRRKKLVILPWAEGGIEVAILMIWFQERWISPTLQAFMDVTRKIIKQSRSSS
jgi:DNA-binding transcriptional LysR family regulator